MLAVRAVARIGDARVDAHLVSEVLGGVHGLVERGGRDEHAPRDGAPALEHERECRVGEVCLLDLAEDVLEVLLDVGDESDKDVRAEMRGRLAWEDDGVAYEGTH